MHAAALRGSMAEAKPVQVPDVHHEVDVWVSARVATHGVLLEPKGGGIRIKVRGQPPVFLPYDSAAAVARELAALAESAGRVRR